MNCAFKMQASMNQDNQVQTKAQDNWRTKKARGEEGNF